jgi:hypothetical protein
MLIPESPKAKRNKAKNAMRKLRGFIAPIAYKDTIMSGPT